MPKELWNHTYTPADIEAATGGGCNVMTLRNFVRRDLFTCAIPEAKAGKPREFPLVAAYEAAILAMGLRYGLSYPLVKQAIARRSEIAAGLETKAVWEGEAQAALRKSPEFEDTDLDDPWYWGIVIGPALWLDQAGEVGGPSVEWVRLFKGDQTIKEVIRRVHLGMVLNVTMIVAQVDDVLTRRLAERKQ